MHPQRGFSRRAQGGLVLLAVATLGTACGGTNVADSGSGSTQPVEQAAARFCDDLGDVIQIVDRYGRVFTEAEVTVGQLQEDATALESATAKLERSTEGLADAIAGANAGTGAPGQNSTTTTLLSAKSAGDHVEDVKAASRELDTTIAGVDGSTPVRDAAVDIQTAAFGLEQAYVALFVDAGCLADDAKALTLVRSYVSGLQQDLVTLGFYSGPVDGLYGSATVAAVKAAQAEAGLPQSGVVDPATEKAIAAQLDAKGKQDSLNVAALQGALKAEGVYDGPIDGVWSDDVEAAVKAYQEQQSLPPTGTIDPATLAALLHAGSDEPPASSTTSTTAAAPTTTPASSTTSTSAP